MGTALKALNFKTFQRVSPSPGQYRPSLAHCTLTKTLPIRVKAFCLVELTRLCRMCQGHRNLLVTFTCIRVDRELELYASVFGWGWTGPSCLFTFLCSGMVLGARIIYGGTFLCHCNLSGWPSHVASTN